MVGRSFGIFDISTPRLAPRQDDFLGHLIQGARSMGAWATEGGDDPEPDPPPMLWSGLPNLKLKRKQNYIMLSGEETGISFGTLALVALGAWWWHKRLTS